MKRLNLTLKKKWFDMIESGEKHEEYREIKPYWAKRLISPYSEMNFELFTEMCVDLKNPTNRHASLSDLLDYFNCELKGFDEVEFKNGYSKTSPTTNKIFCGIDIGIGRQDWGAPDYPVFIIYLKP